MKKGEIKFVIVLGHIKNSLLFILLRIFNSINITMFEGHSKSSKTHTDFVWVSPAQKLRQKSKFVCLLLWEVIVCCHSKNVQLCLFFLSEAYNFLNNPCIYIYIYIYILKDMQKALYLKKNTSCFEFLKM